MGSCPGSRSARSSPGTGAPSRWCRSRPTGRSCTTSPPGYEVSDDGTTYTFKLVEGATWHDGQPVTAADVAFTYNTGLKAGAGSNIGGPARADQGFRRRSSTTRPRTPRASGSSTISRSRSTWTNRTPRSSRTCSASSASRRSTRSRARRWRTMPASPISQELFIGSGPYKMTEFKAKEFVNFEPHPGYKNGTGLQRPAGRRRGLDPDLRRRCRPDPLDPVRRGRLQLRPPPERRQAQDAAGDRRA